MPTPELESDVHAIQELQVELDKRGLVLPKSLMPMDKEEQTLFRFLRARKMNVEAAADMLQNTLKWRDEAKIDECLETFLPDDKDNKLRGFLPSGFVGLDKTGSPVWMEHAAAIDVPGMEAAGISVEDFVYYHCRAMEYMVNCKYVEAAEKSGHPVDNHCVILDLAGLRMNVLNQNTMKVFKALSGVYQDHYPELMSRMFLVNIPLMFAAVWRVLQMFVDDRVKAKIRFLRKADFHILHEFVDRDQLPESLGGKAKEKLLSDKQGFIPPSLLAVNAEVQRRIDARQASTQPQPQLTESHQEDPELISTPAPAEPRLSKDSYYSIIDPQDLPVDLHTSSSTEDLEPLSQPSRPILVSEQPGHQPVGMTDAELSKLAALKSAAQQAQHAQDAGGVQPLVGAGTGRGPVNILAKAGSQKASAADVAAGQGKQRRKSKREKAKGLLSSFTSSRKQTGSQEADMDQALLMLSEMRRTESTPNVEAEALKRNKGGGGPWMSFTRQRRPPKPRSAKRGSASPRRGSPLATVASGNAHSLDQAAAAARATVNGPQDPTEMAERPPSRKWNPFCMKAPLVQGDDDSIDNIGAIDSRQPTAGPTGPPPPQAASATLTQRLSKKLSAIPAYLQTADDPEALRLASAEPSGSSLSGSPLSAAFLQGNVTGRYASAPDLQVLVADSTSQDGGHGVAPDPSPARAPPPRSTGGKGVGRSMSYGQSQAGQKPFGMGAYSQKPILGKAGPAVVAPTEGYHFLKMMQQNEQQTAGVRNWQRNSRFVQRNWELLLVFGFSIVNVLVCLKPIVWS